MSKVPYNNKPFLKRIHKNQATMARMSQYQQPVIAPHAGIRKDAVDVDRFIKRNDLYTSSYLSSIKATHHPPSTLAETIAWTWHVIARFFVTLLTGTWLFWGRAERGAEDLRETPMAARMEAFASVGVASAAAAAVSNHVKSMLFKRPDNGWCHVSLAQAENNRIHGEIIGLMHESNIIQRGIQLLVQFALFFQMLPIHFFFPSIALAYDGYRAEEQVYNYDQALIAMRSGGLREWRKRNVAPTVACKYYGMHPGCAFSDVLMRMKADEYCIKYINFVLGSRCVATEENPFLRPAVGETMEGKAEL